MNKDKYITAGLVAVSFLVMFLSPYQRLADAKYSLLVSQSLVEHGQFDVTSYNIYGPHHERIKKFKNPISLRTGIPYQIERVNNRLYYFFPPGTSILSIPIVAISRAVGLAPADKQGVYSEQRERAIQRLMAAALMAALAGVFYQLARLLLQRIPAMILSIVGTFGTQVWSTASRGLGSHTFGIFLLSIVLYLVFARSIGKEDRKSDPIVIATLASFMFFVRPTFAVSIVSISFLYCLKFPRKCVAYLITGGTWLVLFLLYSEILFSTALPSYYLPNRIQAGVASSFWIALCGNLMSPSRGLFIFLPGVILILYFLILYRRWIDYPGWVCVSFASIAGHLFVVSSFGHWWGGYCYGPRLLTDIVPWVYLLAVIAVGAAHKASRSMESPLMQKAMNALAVFLIVGEIMIHSFGAISTCVWRWNGLPEDVDTHPERLWDWKDAQFLAVFKKCDGRMSSEAQRD